ncbi:Uncharacterised protein [uncultured Ruminococcus sp.]|nr:Uncharacterised protein [uncultured Ruminococcus sp.]
MLERIMDLHILLYLMAVLGTAGGVGMLAVHLTYRRTMRKTKATTNLREKWLNLWKTRDKLLNRMNLLVWIPSLLSTACLGLSLFFVTKLGSERGLPLQYLYIGTAVPVALLILRQALDFSYKEELVTNSLADYILQARSRRENPPTARKYEPQQTAQKTDPVLREEMVERISSSIRQTAATGSHFSKMLSPEEEEIMREIIREFME